MSYNDNNRRGLPDPDPKPQVPSEELSQDLTAVYHAVSEKDIEEYNNKKDQAGDDAYRYGFSKKPSRASKKSGGKNVRLRILLGAIAGLLGVVLGVFFFGLWYKEYLLNQITYETTAPDAVITIVDELGSTVPLSDVTETTQFEVIQDEPVKNFLLIGIDTLDAEIGHSFRDIASLQSIQVLLLASQRLRVFESAPLVFPGEVQLDLQYGCLKLIYEVKHDLHWVASLWVECLCDNLLRGF